MIIAPYKAQYKELAVRENTEEPSLCVSGINIAAEDQKIAGVIAQCPSLDHKKDDKIILRREGLLFFLKLFMHAQRDKGRSRFGLSSHLIPIVGKPGSFAFMTAPGAFEGYAELAKKSKLFINGICARSLLMLQGKNPIQTAQQVNCPVLVQICEYDSTVAPDSHTQVAQILGEKATLVKYPIGHWFRFLNISRNHIFQFLTHYVLYCIFFFMLSF